MGKAWLFLFAFLYSCATTSGSTTKMGIQEDYRSYVSARTAVLNCQPWPSTALFPGLPLSKVDEATRASFFGEVDAHVLESFKGQTFMQGFSPTAVKTFLTENQKTDLLNAIPQLWTFDRTACADCKDLGAYYERMVKVRKEWRTWLLDLSTATHSSDSVLIPFVTFANEDQINDRGLLISKRSMGVALFLVEVQSGDLIWYSKAQNAQSQHVLTEWGQSMFPAFPDWKLVTKDLLVETLWREYPGRIFF